MSENGEIYTAGKKFYTPAGTDGMDKFHLWIIPRAQLAERLQITFKLHKAFSCQSGEVHWGANWGPNEEKGLLGISGSRYSIIVLIRF